ncbi:TrmH family RNA methyltransferase [Planctomycetes bacterium K23_9]|uniref:23S rRNA (Guanosine-2'-O-)-methyltransferase RlmB n=1 Tax=Stieleria marina TaxID=1930275 RepID=A0A517P161_9BACT|nr:23S rRNA (guanosine-2'-O-)-methyltransferase RlmB [Planctomycetes bacterium K23_9]
MAENDRPPLQSTSNPTVRRLVRLRDNRNRRRSRRVIVDGWREAQRASDAKLELVGAYVLQQDAAQAESLIGTPVQVVSAAVMEKISFGQSPRGVVAEFIEPDRKLDDLVFSDSPLILVLDRIEKPGNIGAVFRCADGAGVDAVLMSDCQSDLFNPNSIRSSLGAVFTVPAVSDSIENVQVFLQKHSIRVLAARVESSSEMGDADLSTPLAIVLGNESSGLQDRWQSVGESEVHGVRIPMHGHVDSLNISVSAAVLAFEATRRKAV